ncbi:SDR family oxidoreductase [Microvirga sp. GCM10011540]|uniref:SDR family oxidoreductase n=1 Tax=Microvirga sp. GCM10011540 TaxID=3317338 RepID=UPI00361249E9
MKTILITGASRGIGRSAALLAGERGWSVGVNYTQNRSAADEVVDLVTRSGGRAVAIQGDVAVENDVVAMFDRVEQALGPLDGVVANAGIVGPPQALADMSGERMRRMFEVNVLGAYLCAREAARRLSKSRGGRGGSLVLVSSIAARFGSPFEYVDYAGSKAAVDTLALGLSKELGAEGVRVNSVRPGVTETDIHASGGQPDRAQRVGATTPFGRAGRPEEIAEAIVWLLSDASSYVSGALLDVSGGR